MGKPTLLGSDWEDMRSIVEEHQSALIRYARSFLRDTERSKDIVQEAFIKLCRQPREKVIDHLRPWLFRVTRNAALDTLRKENKMSLYKDAEAMEGLVERSDDSPGKRRAEEAIGSLFDMVKRLPGKQREVVLLKFQQDLSYREISEVTGMTVSNVGYVLHHAIKELRERCAAANKA